MGKSALIVAHGQPSAPAAAAADLARLAGRVAGLLPGWRVASATLAEEGALAAALAGLARPLVFPFFMADGWFTATALPERLERAGVGGLTVLPAFGVMAEVQGLAVRALLAAAESHGWPAGETDVVLAAHGSGRSPAPAAAAERLAHAARAAGFARVRLGFIEEEPSIADAAAGLGRRVLCLPLFVARWGHVETDVPAALARAAFAGDCLQPIGAQPEVPAIIAAELRRAAGGPRA